MALNPIKRAFLRGVELGESRARSEVEAQLREQASLHVGLSGDAHRRKALNSAADSVRDRRSPGGVVAENARPAAEIVDTTARLRPDVTPQAVEALRLAADNMPISRPGQQWAGAADWLRRRARAFEVALQDADPPEMAQVHHPRCYQNTGVPDDLPADLCDCRVLRMIDEGSRDSGIPIYGERPSGGSW